MTFSTYKRSFFLCCILTLLVFSSPAQVLARKPASVFPTYTAIQHNVVFWEKIYSRYSTSTAVVHDKNDLRIIYTIVKLYDPTFPGARKFNTQILERTKTKYAKILTRLSAGRPGLTSDEKRIASLFKGKNSRKRMAKAAKNIRVQMGLKERFLEGVVRSGAYMKKIKTIFRSYNLPGDLAYLAHVESSFNFKAYSKYGAVGIWQFTRTTGREYMTVNYEIDERRDPFIATHAAAKFLKKNYRSLKTWPLAITAYNYGPSGMYRAVKSKGTYSNIFRSYNEGYFKFAARNFYSEFLAARNVAKRLERSPRVKLAAPLVTHSFKLHGYAHFNDISRHLQIPPKELHKLNPALQSPILKGEKYIPKGFRLRLPSNHKTQHLLATLPNSLYKRNQRRSKYHKVQQGDTLGKIARSHRVTLKKLRIANNLKSSATIYVGQKLRIPSKAQFVAAHPKNIVASTYKKKHVPKKRLIDTSKITELNDSKKTRPSSAGTSKERSLSFTNIRVKNYHRQGGSYYGKITSQDQESLGMYARWLKTSRHKLSKLNKLKAGSKIKPGQQITVRFNNVSKSYFEDKRFLFHSEREKKFFSSFQITGMKKYTVTSGDTLWELCYTKFQLPYWLLKKYNSDLEFNKLAANQSLTVPIVKSL